MGRWNAVGIFGVAPVEISFNGVQRQTNLAAIFGPYTGRSSRKSHLPGKHEPLDKDKNLANSHSLRSFPKTRTDGPKCQKLPINTPIDGTRIAPYAATQAI